MPAAKRTTKAKPKPRVTVHCATGRHHLCHGTVYVWNADGTRDYLPCECPVEDCGHGRRDKR